MKIEPVFFQKVSPMEINESPPTNRQCNPRVADYILEVPAKCFQYGATVTEKTLVEPA
jgi:hypothetical protein